MQQELDNQPGRAAGCPWQQEWTLYKKVPTASQTSQNHSQNYFSFPFQLPAALQGMGKTQLLPT